MIGAADPTEEARVAALNRYHIVDTPDDLTFDHLTDLAASVFDVPVACITLVDSDRIFIKSGHGLDIREMNKEPGLCTSTVSHDGVRYLPDTRVDPEVAEHSSVKAGVHFYAGAPLTTPDGFRIGTFCILDMQPREIEESRLEQLLKFASFAMDEIERHRVTVELDRAQEAAVRSQEDARLKSLGMLAGTIAHDFNNILLSILGNANLAAAKLPSGSAANPHLEKIDRATERASALCGQLLGYAGRNATTRRVVCLNQVVRDLSELSEVAIRGKCRFETELQATLPALECDPTQIRQIILNLLTNAADAVESDGCVALRTRSLREPDDDWLVDARASRPPNAGYLLIEVEDDGCGIDEVELERIFDPFYTTKFTGHGLGLAAVQGIVQAHEGAIRVESSSGRGTKTQVLLPATSSAPDEPEPQASPRLVPAGVGHVLVADDDEMIRDLAQMTLSEAGYAVSLAGSGEEVLERLDAGRDSISLVLLDAVMPRGDGASTLKVLRERYADLPVILSSGYDQVEATRLLEGPSEAPSRFLKKPYRPSELLESVRLLLED